MKTTSRVSLARSLLVIAGLVPAPTLCAQTQSDTTENLTPYVVTATRTPIAVTTAGSAIDVLSADDLARMQLPLMRDALSGIPGAPTFASGATGAVTSLFLRGTNSNQTLFLVDGIRFNDPNTDYAVALGGASPLAGDSLEVARGPQSTLYGAEAVGGVVALRSQRGSGTSSGSVAVEAGSFGTVLGAVTAQGGDAAGAYTFSAAGGHTDNQRINNAFDSATYALRLDRKITDAIAVGLTWRGFNAAYGDPGANVGFDANDPTNRARENNQLATLFADFGHGTDWTSHVVLGGQDRLFSEAGTDVRNLRTVLDWQTTYTASPQQRVTGGFTGELNHTVSNGFGDIDHSESLWALFVQDEWSPVQNVYLTGGLRYDDFDTFGSATTGRVTAAWLTDHDRLKFRGSYGTGFRAPGFLDLYGQSPYYVGNPDLKAETARGWDAGVDYYLADNHGTLSATFFRTDLKNLITYDFNAYPSTEENVDQAHTQGVEVAGKFDLPGAWKVRVAYTYLDAVDLTNQTRLLRRPRHSGSLDLWHEFGGGFSAGAGAVFAAEGQDVDAATYATVDQPSHTVVRLYGTWQATKRLAVKVRIENLLDRKYEEVNGYPALGIGAFGGVEWKW